MRTYRSDIDSRGAARRRALGSSLLASVVLLLAVQVAPASAQETTGDMFADAVALASDSGRDGATNLDATKEEGEPDHAGNAGGASIWYSWQPTANGTASVDVLPFDSQLDTLLAVYTGTELGGLIKVASNDDCPEELGSCVRFRTSNVQTYWIAIDGKNTGSGAAQGDVRLTWGLTAGSWPRNDDFANADFISGRFGTASGSNVGATKQDGEPTHLSADKFGGDGLGHSVWYRWTAPSSNLFRFFEVSQYRAILCVYTGAAVDSLTRVDCGNGLARFGAVEGTVYWIVVDEGAPGAWGLITLRWNPGLAVSSFSPASGPAGATVTVDGYGFTEATAVKFGGIAASSHTIVSDTRIRAVVPVGASSGPITIQVAYEGGRTAAALSGSSFTVTPSPSISSFTPTSGPNGTSVTISGSNFQQGATVKFNGVASTVVLVDDATQIRAGVPNAATTGPITVVNPDAGSATSSSKFIVTNPPVITGFSPTSGAVGTVVTISGSYFANATSVKFGGVEAATFSVNSAGNQITATVPPGAASGPISVTTLDGTRTSSSSFTVTSGTATLTVNRTGTGSGTVTSTPAGINCGLTCSANFDQGASVTLTATPASGSTFAGWSGACSGTSTCTLTMDASKSATATFNTSSSAAGTKDVGVYNYYFSPKAPVVPQGYAVRWTVKQGTHTATDASGMSYFNSGPKSVGQTYSHTFTAAGGYKYRSTASGDPSTMVGTIKVPLQVAPLTGSTTTSFTVTWASKAPAASYFSDVAYRFKPCAKTQTCTWQAWTNWKTNETSATSAGFISTKGRGTYQLRARFGKQVTSSTKKFSLWSAPVTISVT